MNSYFKGIYVQVEFEKTYKYYMDDGRKAHVKYTSTYEGVKASQTIKYEYINLIIFQSNGRQTIL